MFRKWKRKGLSNTPLTYGNKLRARRCAAPAQNASPQAKRTRQATQSLMCGL